MSLIFDNPDYNNILDDINSNKNINRDNVCAICRDNLLVDTIDLHCKHRYHTECLLNSFIKYDTKKCPLCDDHFIIESYKTTCIKKMNNNKICNKVCYNNENLCKVHVRTYLKELEKNAVKATKKEISKIKKTIKTKNTKLNALTKDINYLQSEILSLEIQLQNMQ